MVFLVKGVKIHLFYQQTVNNIRDLQASFQHVPGLRVQAQDGDEGQVLIHLAFPYGFGVFFPVLENFLRLMGTHGRREDQFLQFPGKRGQAPAPDGKSQLVSSRGIDSICPGPFFPREQIKAALAVGDPVFGVKGGNELLKVVRPGRGKALKMPLFAKIVVKIIDYMRAIKQEHGIGPP